MSYYYIEKTMAEGLYRVHSSRCPQMPSPVQREFIGSFAKSSEALQEAQRIYRTAQACAHCMR